jgi:hypothetical protein
MGNPQEKWRNSSKIHGEIMEKSKNPWRNPTGTITCSWDGKSADKKGEIPLGKSLV